MRTKATLILSLALLASAALHAGTKTWEVGNGTWQTATHWDPDGVPNNTDTIFISNGEVEYVAGGDLSIASGGSLTIGPGGKFFQTGNISWMQLAGTVVVDGGEFDTGTAGQLQLGGSIIVTSGVFRARANVNYTTGGASLRFVGGTTYATGNFTVSDRSVFAGGDLVVGGELQYSTPVTFTKGMIRARMIAAQSGTAILTLTGGHIIVTGDSWDGFYQNGTFVNFAEPSTGMITFTNCTPATAYSKYFSGANPKIRLDGAVVSEANLALLFTVAESSVPGMGNSVDISLKQAEAGQATFVDNACAASGLTATSVVITATINDPGSPVADVFACYGTVNGLLNFAAWENPVFLGAAQSAKAYTNTPPLNPDTVYFYRVAATNGSGAAFAAPSPAFVMTAPVGVLAPRSIPENSATPAAIVISRPAANNCSAVELSVPFTVGGTATPGTHYTLSTASPANIPANADSVTVSLTPIADWATGTERTVVVTLQTSPNYLATTNASVTVTLLDAVLPSYPTNAFIGSVSQDSADPANWSLGVVPAASHIIVFSPEFARNQLSWSPGTTNVVAGWLQAYPFPTADYRVLFHTTPEEPLTITGDCVLNGGYWIHDGPSTTPSAAVAVSVQGNLTVGAGAQINAGNGGVNQVNGGARGYYLAGPGYLPSAGDAGTGSSFGGEGSTNAVTYGSILNPLSYGSSGRGDNAFFAGGGLVVLNVSGTTTLNGSLLSKGFGYTGTGRSASTGGTINLTTGRLLGNGMIGVDGGLDANYGSGSGGRIRVKLTDVGASFADFTGSMTAYGNAGVPGSAAGTITLQTAADSAATARVIVDNARFSDSTNTPSRAMCTHLPPKEQTDASFAGTSWVLRDYASVRLTRDVLVNSLSVEGTTPRLFTETYTVTTKEFRVNGVALRGGTYTSADYPGLLHGSGAVVVAVRGSVVLLL